MEKEIRDYQRLNTIAEKGGVVIFGEKEDKEIPVGELKQSFNLDYSAYNRSFSELNLDNAIKLYDSCIIPLRPDTVMIHIGGSEEYWKDIAGFEQKYILLINHIQAVSKNVRIVVISVDDEEKNRHLKNISDSTHSEFQNLLNVFLTEIHFLIINNHTRHAHYIILVLQSLKMADIIHMGRHI